MAGVGGGVGLLEGLLVPVLSGDQSDHEALQIEEDNHGYEKDDVSCRDGCG